MKSKIEADECLYCGCPDQWMWEPGPGLKAVACGNKACNATGPVSTTIDGATALWNKPPRLPKEVAG